MPDNIRVQANPQGEASRNVGSAAGALTTDSLQDITEIARKLAAHGGGATSLDLAFDLVLHGIVEQARAVSGATGSAIALNRDGKMVCRATTGENAPDLGVSVGAASGLTGICLKTGAIQHCQDTESDSRVEPETCRRLGVRSMLLIPLVDTDGTFGVLQLFSSSPNAFAGQEMTRLLRLADRVAENRRAMLPSAKPALNPDSMQVLLPDQLKPKRTTDGERRLENDVFPPQAVVAKGNELWTAVLFLLVIVAAISLGIAVGWRNGRKAVTTPGALPQSSALSGERTQVPIKPAAQDAATDSTPRVDPFSNIHGEGKSVAVPVGGLVVTENGKVIYRSSDDSSKQSLKQSVLEPGARELIHQVEPDYPPAARAQHVEGLVILDVEIAKDGSVANAVVVSGDPLLTSAALQAVKQWQYQPDPAGPSRTRVTLQFTLPVN
jgi:TonB family protein